MLPSARAVHEKWGIPTSVVIAQGALESEWGTKHPGNEYFGVKSHGSTGPTTSIATHEVGAGGRHAERDSFRAYASLAEAADDYGRFMTTQPRYRHAFEHTDDPHRFVQEVAKAKWGTDPDYAEKVNGVIDRHRLTRHDAPEQTASSSAPNAKALWAAVAQRGRDAMRASLGEQEVRLGATNVISPQATAPPQTQAAMPTLRLRR